MRDIPLILFGAGQVGRALVQMLQATRAQQARLGVALPVVALADSSGALVDERGLPDQVLDSALRLKARGGALTAHELGAPADDPADLVDVAGQADAVVVDTTAADPEMILPALLLARRRGYGIVLANKKPLTTDYTTFKTLTTPTPERPRPLGYEATVGAGLPVIRTLHMLLETGDEIATIRGAFSGTLGYLMTEMQAGVRFSQAVRAAKELGYTEPDPRDDLSGIDVARKALILARTIGLPLEMEDVAVEPLFTPEMATLPRNEFLARLEEMDGPMAAQMAAAAAQGTVLRYSAIVDTRGARVGLSREAPASPLGVLRGPDNLVAFETGRYTRTPLVVQGAGAGAEVTASAVLADLLTIVTAA